MWAISDDAAQVWLTRCAFRKPVNDYHGLWGEVVHDKPAGTSYASLDEEIKALEAALSGGA